MEKILDDFLSLMAANGCAPQNPDDIIPDDKLHRIASEVDKRGSKTLTYQLAIDGDFGYGWFHSFKHGETINFVAKPGRGYTAEQKQEFVTRSIEARKLQKIREEIKKKKQLKLAGRLKKLIKNYRSAVNHVYLERKNIAVHGVKIREKTGEILIPIFQNDGLPWSLQRITHNGDKWFFTGGMVDGGYYPLATKDDSRDVLIIVEGFATGATIRAVLPEIPVIVAFNAGNLKKVALSFRHKYPLAKIVIAADDDRFTRNAKGLPWNPGVEKAREAAVSVKGFVLIPEFPDGDTGTDWNDYVNTRGDSQLREKFSLLLSSGLGSDSGGVPTPTTIRPPLTVEGDWRDKLICNKDGVLVRGSLRNAMLFLQNHPKFAGIFRLNDFQKDIFVTKCPPWSDEATFRVHRMEDNDITRCAAELEVVGASIPVNNVVRAISTSAEEAKFHPARDFFDSLVWDGISRLDTWLLEYLGAEEDSPEYLEFAGKKWLTAAVKRIYEPGCKFDHVLVIEGAQGGGKSTLLREMATFGDEAYFTDNVKVADIGKDNTIIMLQGSIIVELAELAGFNKKDDEEIKGWITVREDRCRRPYDKTVSYFPRQFVLAATTNNYEYLKDPSGNRRYWPVKAGVLNVQGIQRDRLQLWAEAVMLYKSGFYVGPTESEQALAREAQEKRLSMDAWEEDVLIALRKIDTFAGFKTRDLMDKMGLTIKDRDDRAARRVSGILRAHGYELKAKWENGKTQKLWVSNV